VNRFGGVVECPNPDVVCDASHTCEDYCSLSGTCSSLRTCTCDPGFHGAHCQNGSPTASYPSIEVNTVTKTCASNEYYDAAENICYPCHRTCASCDGVNSDNCVVCDFGHWFADVNYNICVAECSSGYNTVDLVTICGFSSTAAASETFTFGEYPVDYYVEKLEFSIRGGLAH
jgi:hypothetical protein